MISDALQFLNEQSKQARRVIDTKLGDKRNALLDIGGNVVPHPLPVPRLGATVRTVESLAAALKHYDDNETTIAIWVSLDRVVAVFHDVLEDYRDDRITLPLHPSPVFGTLRTMEKNTYEQQQLLQVLRHDLKPTTITPEGFDLAVSALKFSTVDDEEGKFTANKSDSMGRSIRAEVEGNLDRFQTVNVAFLPYPALIDEVPEEVSVGCGVNLLVRDRRIRVAPYPGELEKAETTAVDLVRKAIEDALPSYKGRVFCGTP